MCLLMQILFFDLITGVCGHCESMNKVRHYDSVKQDTMIVSY